MIKNIKNIYDMNKFEIEDKLNKTNKKLKKYENFIILNDICFLSCIIIPLFFMLRFDLMLIKFIYLLVIPTIIFTNGIKLLNKKNSIEILKQDLENQYEKILFFESEKNIRKYELILEKSNDVLYNKKESYLKFKIRILQNLKEALLNYNIQKELLNEEIKKENNLLKNLTLSLKD